MVGCGGYFLAVEFSFFQGQVLLNLAPAKYRGGGGLVDCLRKEKRRNLKLRRFFASGMLFLNKFDHARLLGTFALGFVQLLLSQAEVLWRGFNEFIHVNIFQRSFEREF